MVDTRVGDTDGEGGGDCPGDINYSYVTEEDQGNFVQVYRVVLDGGVKYQEVAKCSCLEIQCQC